MVLNVDMYYNKNIHRVENEKNNDRKNWENSKRAVELKNEELEKLTERLKTKMARMETDDIKFSESLKKSIFRVIDEN